MQFNKVGNLSPSEQAKLGRIILNTFVEESGGMLGPVGSFFEFERFDDRPSFSPFIPLDGIAFVWGRRTTETGWCSIGVPMKLSWVQDCSVEEIRAVAREVQHNWEQVQSGNEALQERYLKAYCMLQVETLRGIFPHADTRPPLDYCKACADLRRSSAAEKPASFSTG